MNVPVTEWNYIAQKADTLNKYYASIGLHYDKAPVHIGPMAQDFAEAFGYGEFKDKITSTDIDGVMFSAIQALAKENQELQKQIDELKKLINDLKTK